MRVRRARATASGSPAAVPGVSWIGRVLAGSGARFVDDGRERPLAGFEHRLG